MTIQDKINEAVQTVKEACKFCPEEQREQAINFVQELGYEWQSVNITARLLSVALGLVSEGKTIDAVKETDELEALESKGSAVCFKTIPLPIYSALHTEYLTEAMGGMEE